MDDDDNYDMAKTDHCHLMECMHHFESGGLDLRSMLLLMNLMRQSVRMVPRLIWLHHQMSLS